MSCSIKIWYSNNYYIIIKFILNYNSIYWNVETLKPIWINKNFLNNINSCFFNIFDKERAIAVSKKFVYEVNLLR